MKKFASILLALAMILSLCIPAFADDPKYTLIINGAAGHKYDIYQIFTGDIAEEGTNTVLTNVRYGVNHYPVGGVAGALVPTDALQAIKNSADPVAYLESSVNNRENPYLDDLTPTEGENSIKVENIPGGYYMIVDDSDELSGQTKSPIMLQVLGDVTVTSKHATIVSEKKVDDKNDSNNSEDAVNWQDSADYDIGDAVPFRLSVTLPSTLGAYNTYELTFHDKQAAGFDTPVITSVYILKPDNTTQISVPEVAENNSGNGYTLHTSCTRPDTCEFGGCSFNVTVGNIKALYGQNTFAEGDKLIVEYTAELNDTANVGKEGNVNGMYVCHPDGHTPKDAVVVFTYDLKVNKIDGDSKEALEGAGFTLYKWDNDVAGEDKWVKVCDEIKGMDNTGNPITTFTWSGIDDGKYKLVETTTPAGYNTIADIEFVVTADHKVEWIAGGNSAFEDLIAKDANNSNVIVFADATGESAVEDGKLEGDVENFKGVVLPETGAKGTIYLLACSAMLVLIAAVFMVTRKKMSVYED